MSWNLIEKAKKITSEEKGGIHKHFGGKISVALIYPNTYYVGMSNLGFQTVYYSFNKRSNVVCERVFLPDSEDCIEFEKTKTSLFSLESQHPVNGFDIIAFSISFENDYLNVLKILDLAGIPFLAEDREQTFPLIIAGGVCAFLNPEPISKFVDMFIIGEGEEILNELIEKYEESINCGCNKEEIIKNMASIPGTYIPKFYQTTHNKDGTIKSVKAPPNFPPKIKKRIIHNLNTLETINRITTPHTEFSNMFLVEISRGCKRGCRFCAAGFIYRPFRFHHFEHIIQLLKKEETPLERVGLVGTAVSDHPQIDSLCQEIRKLKIKMAVSSLRVDSVTEEMIKSLAESGCKTVSLAPETGSEKLRKIIGKNITDQDIYKTIEMIINHNILNIRLYFMIGLPGEENEDIEAIIEMVKKIKHKVLKIGRAKKRLGRITISINNFIPKPFTPFQWSPFEDEKTLNQKLNYLKKSLRKIDNVNVIHDLPKWAYIQALLSRGDRRVGDLLLLAYQTGGDWKKAFRQASLNPDFYVYRERNLDEIFPWDHLDLGVDKKYLIKEYLDSQKN